jgi:hypothetical protein
VTDFLQKDGFTMLNTAQLLGSVNIVTIKCPCKQIIMGQMGQPLICVNCSKTWWVSSKAQITIQEVIADLTKQDSSLLTQ